MLSVPGLEMWCWLGERGGRRGKLEDWSIGEPDVKGWKFGAGIEERMKLPAESVTYTSGGCEWEVKVDRDGA